jgi:hypothetical protein
MQSRFHLPPELAALIESTARDIGCSRSDVAREALALGLSALRFRKLERGRYLERHLYPIHPFAVHEAGHAVMVMMIENDRIAEAEDEASTPELSDSIFFALPLLESVYLADFGDEYSLTAFSSLSHCFSPRERLRITVAGCVADAKKMARPSRRNGKNTRMEAIAPAIYAMGGMKKQKSMIFPMAATGTLPMRSIRTSIRSPMPPQT